MFLATVNATSSIDDVTSDQLKTALKRGMDGALEQDVQEILEVHDERPQDRVGARVDVKMVPDDEDMYVSTPARQGLEADLTTAANVGFTEMGLGASATAHIFPSAPCDHPEAERREVRHPVPGGTETTEVLTCTECECPVNEDEVNA